MTAIFPLFNVWVHIACVSAALGGRVPLHREAEAEGLPHQGPAAALVLYFRLYSRMTPSPNHGHLLVIRSKSIRQPLVGFVDPTNAYRFVLGAPDGYRMREVYESVRLYRLMRVKTSHEHQNEHSPRARFERCFSIPGLNEHGSKVPPAPRHRRLTLDERRKLKMASSRTRMFVALRCSL
jgi:hypothetical protein